MLKQLADLNWNGVPYEVTVVLTSGDDLEGPVVNFDTLGLEIIRKHRNVLIPWTSVAYLTIEEC